MNDFYFVAQIISAGKDGFVKIQLEQGFSDKVFEVDTKVFLDFWGKKKKFLIEDLLKVKNSLFVKFFHFDDDREIQVLIGHKVFIKNVSGKLKKNKSSVIQDLIGCKVYKGNVTFGTVNDFFNAPANDVIEVIKDDGEKLLLPFVDAFFEIMDVKNKKLVLKSDAGFYDDED